MAPGRPAAQTPEPAPPRVHDLCLKKKHPHDRDGGSNQRKGTTPARIRFFLFEEMQGYVLPWQARTSKKKKIPEQSALLLFTGGPHANVSLAPISKTATLAQFIQKIVVY